ncbi:TonB-dependent receptor plug domain-containing protein [Phenylobacterium aquaticum]|uniref:TonB-dependent receptor plug domain-containing protein n=1 Tax=Phenylobacterium aquaticum TaxID=1763816 RepID=UPI001F5D7EAA|nr:TonB-dependent receptor [Phenylobacterium aquaticum]MCI3132123.1 TonB-dependent receptor [Phenylobacterium aquaticum]
MTKTETFPRQRLRARALLLTAASVIALGGAARAAEADATDVEAVVVTGVRGGVHRTVADSPAPIDVIQESQLTDTGKVGLKEVLNTLLPSFNLPGINGGGTSWTVRAITLRGLNGDQALFLVNGKRRHTTALINNLARVGRGGVPVDLDLIPSAAIDHIEVLRDGAAAQYGSDAIAGVINIILKDKTEGGEVSAQAGRFYLADGETYSVSANYARPLGQAGFVDFGFNWKNNAAASRAIPSQAKYIYPALANGSPDPRDATVDRYYWGQSYGAGEEDLLAASYNGELPLANGITVYSFGTLSHRASKKNTGSFLPNNTIRPNTTTALPEVYPLGFNALRRIFELDEQVAVGARGATSGWAWDLSTTAAHDNAQLDAENTLNATLGPASPTYFHLSTHRFDQVTTNLDVSRDYQVGLAKPLSVAWGLEQRYEQFEILPGDAASYVVGSYVIPAGQPFAGKPPAPGLSSYAGTTPADAGKINRNTYAAYVDLGTNLTRTWYVGAAGRFEHYTGGVGDTTSGKFSTRWEFLPGYALRATVSNGFRAPSLAQTIFASSTFTSVQCPPPAGVVANCIAGQPYVSTPTKVLPVFTPVAKALGAEPLRPETSVNYSAGLTAEPISRLRLTLDAYQIEIKDRIVDTGTIKGPVVGAILAANGLQSDLSVSYYTNAVDTRTRGLDAVAEYSFDLKDWGDLRLSGAYAWTKTVITHLKPTPAVLSSLGYALFDRQKQADLTIAQPRNKVILSATWDRGPLTVAFRETRYGSWTEAGAQAVSDRTFSGKWVADLDVSYEVNPTTTVALGANNLFDQYPDKIGVLSPDTGTGQYGNLSPFGITGGYYYGRVTRRF